MTTVYRKLLSKGYTKEEIQEEINRDIHRNTEFGLCYFTEDESDKDAEPIIGFTYNADFRYEEEEGAGKLSTMLDVVNLFPRQENIFHKVNRDGHIYYVIFTEENMPEYKTSSLDYYLDELDKERELLVYRLRDKEMFNKTVKQMRAKLKEKGVSPLPTKRNQALKSYAKNILGRDIDMEVNQGFFHLGDIMVLDTVNPMIADVLDIFFEDAAKRNTISVGGNGNPFGHSVSFYDTSDFSQEFMDNIRAQRAEYEKKMEDVADVKDELEEIGMIHALSPSGKTEDGQQLYLMNFSLRYNQGKFPDGTRQCFGLFTIDELHKVAQR